MEFSSLESESSLSRINEGVFYFNETPEYYVVHVEQQVEEYVLVYPIHDKTSEVPTIKHRRVKEDRTEKLMPGGTRISNIIKGKIGKNEKYKVVYAEPFFVSTIVENKKDTITGNYGRGFYERTPEKVNYATRDSKIEGGNYTGVFITLASIKWLKSYVPIESALEMYQNVKEARINV